jgi:hypothetical protein
MKYVQPPLNGNRLEYHDSPEHVKAGGMKRMAQGVFGTQERTPERRETTPCASGKLPLLSRQYSHERKFIIMKTH